MAQILCDAFNYRLWVVQNTMWQYCLQTTKAWTKGNQTLKGLFSSASNSAEMERMDSGWEGAVKMYLKESGQFRQTETWKKSWRTEEPADTPRTPQWQLMLKDEKQLDCGGLPRCKKWLHTVWVLNAANTRLTKRQKHHFKVNTSLHKVKNILVRWEAWAVAKTTIIQHEVCTKLPA